MVRTLRTILALEGAFLSWQSFAATAGQATRADRGDPGAPDSVALTSAGSLFGPPNGVPAMAYFGLVALGSATGIIDRPIVRRASILAAWTSLGISGYLLYQLQFVLKRDCSLCVRTHTLNLAVSLALMASREPGERRGR
ncbi:MAG TPA: vitamin K epoxide reductase family protein [Chloroflexota bacterium]|nr:vitamin K epoxide reductase family protein [Chloroflexota bacterium]